VSSFKPSERADQVQSREEVACGFLVARGDTSELLDIIEEAFDEVAFGVEREIAIARLLAIRFWWDDRFDGSNLKAADEAIGVVAFVAEDRFGPHLRGEHFGLNDVMDLPTGETEHQRIAQGIDDRVDFAGKAPARAAYRLVEAPFFRAPALC